MLNRFHTYTYIAPHFDVLHQVVLKALRGKRYASKIRRRSTAARRGIVLGSVPPQQEVARGRRPSPLGAYTRTRPEPSCCQLGPLRPLPTTRDLRRGKTPPPPQQKRERPSLSHYFVKFSALPTPEQPANFPTVQSCGQEGCLGPQAGAGGGRGEPGRRRGAGWAGGASSAPEVAPPRRIPSGPRELRV